MRDTASHLALFSFLVAVPASLLICLLAIYYMRRVRLDRPPIGTFNGRDLVVLFVALATIPLFYEHLPRTLLTCCLVVTFMSSLSIGYRPVLGATGVWLAVGVLLGTNIWLGNRFLGSVFGWQVYWSENDVVVLAAAVAVANLYVQGGMKFKHTAWFAFVLAFYDVVFTTVWPVTDTLVQNFLGFPLDPSVGMRWSFDNAAIGIGDLLVYGLFALGAFKAYGRSAARTAIAVVVTFGAIVPAYVPLLINYIDARADTLVPAQAWFGPMALLTYYLMRRKRGPERTMREFLASDDVTKPYVVVSRAVARPALVEDAPAAVEEPAAV